MDTKFDLHIYTKKNPTDSVLAEMSSAPAHQTTTTSTLVLLTALLITFFKQEAYQLEISQLYIFTDFTLAVAISTILYFAENKNSHSIAFHRHDWKFSET